MARLTTGKPLLNVSAIQYRMKIIHSTALPLGKATHSGLAKVALGTVIVIAVAACATPADHHESAVPLTYSQATYHQPAGVLNTPNNTGNSPEDLDPHTIHWGDVRPNY